MRPPLVPPSPRPVNLKTTCPVGLLTAFAEEQWTNASNLAKQRYRVTKDPYYQAVEIAAKSQGDNVADRGAGKIEVEKMVKENTTVTDVDALDLYEFSCSRADINYSETIGLLRARLVKALPKDQNACTRCFDACVWNSDWKNAQQIAASLNKNFVNDRKFLFRYILATHQYSVRIRAKDLSPIVLDPNLKKLSDECPEGSRKIFASLARAQADKAFDFRVMTSSKDYHLDRAAVNESEAWLWLKIRITHCDPKENLELFRKPDYSPLTFLNLGQLEPYWIALGYLQGQNAWDDIFQIGKEVLEEAIRISQSEASAIEQDEKVVHLRKLAEANEQDSSVKEELALAIAKAKPMRTLKDYSYIAASCEYGLFTAVFQAARHQPDRKRALKQVRQLIDKVIKALTRAGGMKPIFQRTHSIVALSILVARDSPPSPEADGNTTRVVHLTNHVIAHYNETRCLVEAISLLAGLSRPEVVAFLTSLRTRGIKCTDPFQRFMLMSLGLRIRYSVITSSDITCALCNSELDGPNCASCLKSIAANALDAYRSGVEDDDVREKILSGHNENPLSDITVVGAVCLLRIAGLGQLISPWGTSPLYHANIQLFLQAVVWLDSCLATSPPVSNTHRLLLMKLYLLMGCVSRAKALWDRFDVKNALLDSLGLLYIDRLSSIAPGLFVSGSSRDNPVEPFMVHFTRALTNTIPRRIMDSLEMGNYSSVQEMAEHAKKQAACCTLAMAVVEERRGLRMKAGKMETPIEDQPLVRRLVIDHELKDITDYKIFSIPEGEQSVPVSALVSCGPLPTNGRAHLGLIAERFLDFVCYVQPKEYKPSKPGQVIQLDWKYAYATCSHLEQDMRVLLAILDFEDSEDEKIVVKELQGSIKKSLTSSEHWYYKMIWRLAYVVKHILNHGLLSPSTNEAREQSRILVKSIVEGLEDQTRDFLDVPENLQSKIYAFHGFAALHAMGMLRETILAVKHTANYLTTVSEKAKNTDKLRAQADLAWLAPELKKVTAAAIQSENTIKARIKLLKDYLGNVDGWRDRLCDWVFGDYAGMYDKDAEFKRDIRDKVRAAIPKGKAELWADRVGESWRELMKGWAAVRFD